MFVRYWMACCDTFQSRFLTSWHLPQLQSIYKSSCRSSAFFIILLLVTILILTLVFYKTRGDIRNLLLMHTLTIFIYIDPLSLLFFRFDFIDAFHQSARCSVFQTITLPLIHIPHHVVLIRAGRSMSLFSCSSYGLSLPSAGPKKEFNADPDANRAFSLPLLVCTFLLLL